VRRQAGGPEGRLVRVIPPSPHVRLDHQGVAGDPGEMRRFDETRWFARRRGSRAGGQAPPSGARLLRPECAACVATEGQPRRLRRGALTVRRAGGSIRVESHPTDARRCRSGVRPRRQHTRSGPSPANLPTTVRRHLVPRTCVRIKASAVGIRARSTTPRRSASPPAATAHGRVEVPPASRRL